MQTDTIRPITRVAAVVVLCITLLAALGCKKETKTDPFLEKWRSMAEQSKGHSPLPRCGPCPRTSWPRT